MDKDKFVKQILTHPHPVELQGLHTTVNILRCYFMI